MPYDPYQILRLVPVLLLSTLFACSDPPQQVTEEIAVDQALGSGADPGFARAVEPREFSFPQDHGPHPEFQHEWWYFTGNLVDADSRRFGYQVTFFRIALAPEQAARTSNWATRQVWMAHVALSDIADGRHHARERFVRDALGLAGARLDPLRVWIEDWWLARKINGEKWQLHVATDAFSLDLALDALRPPVLQGNQGLSQKSAEPGNASYYYSIPRLASQGTVKLGDREFKVDGLSWLDREWSTSALGPEQEGWDWFSLQLDDGTDIMYYQLRHKDGRPDPHSRGSALLADGTRVDLSPKNIELRPLDWWTSDDGRRYPVAWAFHGPPFSRPVEVRALIPDQLMALSVRYWEGAVEVLNTEDATHLGYGYLEMTGY
jgi:predicted secreted hydrolase